MDRENLKKLAGLMNIVLGDSHFNRATIRNPQYNSPYIEIFMDEIEKNNGDATPYDRFGGQLWALMDKDANDYPNQCDELIAHWTAWKTIYDALRAKRKINPE